MIFINQYFEIKTKIIIPKHLLQAKLIYIFNQSQNKIIIIDELWQFFT